VRLHRHRELELNVAGFGSYVQFYRVLRSFMSCTPAQHRRSQASGVDGETALLH
jgi:hypothetical protein